MPKVKGHSILLGGLGSDSHSVGLSILRQSLGTNGYQVCYLGTQNVLESFTRYAPFFNVVMVSCMDGHAQRYLREFPTEMQRPELREPLWYLGGNIAMGDGLGYERLFLEMGFDRVFVKFVDIRRVLALLEQDLATVPAMAFNAQVARRCRPTPVEPVGTVSEAVVEPDLFERARKDVLDHWKTGREARDLEANAEYLARQPSFPRVQAAVNEGRAPILVQPRSGVATLDGQIRLFQAFRDAGVRVLSYQVDSLTRTNRYFDAEEAIRESLPGDSALNGFPVVNHGVPGLRRVIGEVRVPIQTRHSTRDPRLLCEIGYAGGVTAFEGGAICYNIPYYKDYPLATSIPVWQYVDRLTGLYFERFGIALDREFFGVMTGTLIPPSLAIVIDLLEALLAVQQGVKCVSLGYAEQGHRIQDIAAMRVLREMAAGILDRLGRRDVQVNTIFHQFMAAFPQIPHRAEELILQSAVTAALSGATRVLIKTPVEAYKIPSLADNLHGLSLVGHGIALARETAVDERRIAAEAEVIRREAQEIFDSVIYCGDGNLAAGIVRAFQKGYLDVPFSPSIYSRGQVMTGRDCEGAVRFLSPGGLQLSAETRAFHEDKMQDRRRAEGLKNKKQDYLLVEKDVLQIGRSQYERWPLSG